MTRPRTLLLLLATTVALGVGLAVRSAGADPSTVLEATLVDIQREVVTRTYPSVDHGRKPTPKDDREGTTKWRVVASTGNCCENYLTSTPQGRLFDFGGTYVHISDDLGVTWKQVHPLTPLLNGEGTIAMAPNGDVLGIGWDPYSGDHLQAFKYEAFSGKWWYNELPLHTPFYDREWITVVPGPFSVDGRTVPYITFLRGGYPSKELYLWSADGLNYVEASSKFVDATQNGTVNTWLTTQPDSSFDWIQPNSNTGLTPLGGGAVLARPDLGSWALLDPATLTWRGYRYGDGTVPAGRHQVDSAGRIHNVISRGSSFDYRISADGGRTWNTLNVQLPAGMSIEHFDFRAHKNSGVAGIAIRATKAGTANDQDLAYKLDISTGTPALKRSYTIGLGDAGATAGVGNSVRMDFQTVTILPNGALAVSFLDSTAYALHFATGEKRADPSPNIAIELSSSTK
jgi:hypothetical protein